MMSFRQSILFHIFLNERHCMKNFFYFFLVFASTSLFAVDEEAPQPPRDQGFMQTLIMIAIAVLFFYLILWRPEQKRRKSAEELRSNLKKGDRVTAMGIVGTVAQIKENTVIVRMVDGSKLEFLKAAITEVVPGIAEEVAAPAEKE